MEFSPGEKLILIMLSDICKRLEIEDSVNPDLIQSALYDGHLWALKWEYTGIFHADTPEDVAREVGDILAMWSFIEMSVEQLSQPDKDRLAEELGSLGKDVRFRGFDGHGESDHVGAARFMVETMGRFDEFQGREFDAHWPTLDGYRRMLSEYREMLRAGAPSLSADQLVKLLKEQIHPSHR